ncbi:MAG: hypothetical protein ACI9DK_001360 [Vicingaceae bacterium]|jgi:hypothetical protein
MNGRLFKFKIMKSLKELKQISLEGMDSIWGRLADGGFTKTESASKTEHGLCDTIMVPDCDYSSTFG